jgi:hypothetical protein
VRRERQKRGSGAAVVESSERSPEAFIDPDGSKICDLSSTKAISGLLLISSGDNDSKRSIARMRFQEEADFLRCRALRIQVQIDYRQVRLE